MRKHLQIAGALALATLIAACGGGNAGQQARGGEVRYPVEVEAVQTRNVDYTVAATGSVNAFETVQVTARVQGVIESVRFKEGDKVSEKQVLVEIEPRGYALGLASAMAAQARAMSTHNDAVVGLNRRKKTASTSPGVFTPEEIESWETKVAVAKAEWDEATVNVKRAELNQEYAKPVSPVDGIIQSRSVQTGQFVQPGTVIATLIRRDPMLLKFEVPERDAAQLSVQQQAKFRVNAVEKELRAEIIHVNASAEGDSRLVMVTAQVNAEDAGLVRPGTFALVTVVFKTRNDAPSIPESAVRPSAEGFLAFVIEDEVAKKRVLQLGLRTSDGRVEVVSGLKPGEVLVIRGAEALRDGVKVSIPGAAPKGAGK